MRASELRRFSKSHGASCVPTIAPAMLTCGGRRFFRRSRKCLRAANELSSTRTTPPNSHGRPHETALRLWVVRHNKGTFWPGTDVTRRQRMSGAAISDQSKSGGLAIPPDQLLPFFLAARSSVNPGQDLLGEALSSSYEAFRFTRQNRDAAKRRAR